MIPTFKTDRRTRQLAKLLGYAPATPEALAVLSRAIRRQRQLARQRHWAYDLNRHLALIEAIKSERQRRRESDAFAVSKSSIR